MTETDENPWTIKKAELVYENPWIAVTHHEVLTPHGAPGVYGTVHFKNLAIGVLPVDHEGYTWLVGQYRFPLREFHWEIPEGGGEHGVDPLLSAQRELKEETGLEATHWRKCLEMVLSNAVSDERSVSFIATGLTQGESAPDPTEQLHVKRVRFDEAVAMVLRGEICDSISVATILRAKLIFDQEGFPPRRY